MATTPDSIVVNVVPTAPPASKVSPKVWASTIGTLAVSLLVALLTAVVNDPATLAQVLDAVPTWLRFVLVAVLPTLVTFLAGYAKRDTTRELGQAVTDTLTHQTPAEQDAVHADLPDGYAEEDGPSPEPEPNGDPHAL